MGCNAWNHSSNCNCGWGGDSGGGWRNGSAARTPAVKIDRVVDGLGVWGRVASSKFASYLNPNAHCPVCGDAVFFYQSESGGRVFFDALGPPWPKHRCTDSGPVVSIRRPSIASEKAKDTTRRRPKNFLGYGKPPKGAKALSEHQARRSYAANGWHPLLQVKVDDVGGGYKRVGGIDAVTGSICSVIIKGDFQSWAPTFIRVIEPERLHSDLDQTVVGSVDLASKLRARGWYGAYTIEEARLAKRAMDGEPDDMFTIGKDRSFRFFRHADLLPDVKNWADIAAAEFWFSAAASKGVAAADLGRAYLQDLVERGSKATPHVDKRDYIEQVMGVARRYQATVSAVDQRNIEFSYRVRHMLFGYIEELKNILKQHRPRHLGRAAKEVIERWQKQIGKP